DVVRKVRDELGGRRVEARRVEGERVLPVERRVRDAGKVGLERSVELDGVDVGDPLGEVAREDAEARPDLEHDVVWLEVREAADDSEDVLVDEEVLAERLLRGDVHSPKAAVALASICRASSAWPSPRASARVA